MDLILSKSVLLVAKRLDLDAEPLLSAETADQLIQRVLGQLSIVIPDNPWAIQYANVHDPEFLQRIDHDYVQRQQQYSRLAGAIDDTGLLWFVRQSLMIELLRLACLRRYESVEQAQAVKVHLREQVDAILLSCTDDMYMHLTDLKGLLVEAIEQQSGTLPHIRYVRYGVSLPALLVSYRLYNSVQREADIVTRNAIRHPGFCPIERDMELLSA